MEMMSMNIGTRSWKDIKRCPACRSKRVVIARYKDGARCLECEGCNTVIFEIKDRKKVPS